MMRDLDERLVRTRTDVKLDKYDSFNTLVAL
jgi:hypothetical protein